MFTNIFSYNIIGKNVRREILKLSKYLGISTLDKIKLVDSMKKSVSKIRIFDTYP